MKLLVVFCLFSLNIFCSGTVNPFISLATAISQLSKKFFSNRFLEINIKIFCSDEKVETAQDLIRLAGMIGKEILVPHQLYIHNSSYGSFHKVICPSIILYESMELYSEVIRNKSLEIFYVLTYVHGRNSDFEYNINKTKKLFRDYDLTVTETLIVLSTFQNYQDSSNCEKEILVKVNEFSLASQSWKSPNFKIERFKNLNQCSINITAPHPQSLALKLEFDGNKPKLVGYVTKFNEIISRKLNFTFKYKTSVQRFHSFIARVAPKSQAQVQRINKNPFKSLKLYEVTTYIKYFASQNPGILLSKPYWQVDQIILVSRFKPYTILEKVILPFEAEVWYWLIGTLLAIAVICCIVLLFHSLKVRKFVFGSQVKTPIMNMMLVFYFDIRPRRRSLPLPPQNFPSASSTSFPWINTQLFAFLVR